MRIVHLGSFFIPTMGYQERYLAKFHQAVGHDVWVVSSALKYPLGDGQWLGSAMGERAITPGLNTTELQGIRVIRLPVSWEKRQRVWLCGLESTLKSINPDIIVMHGMNNLNNVRVVLMRLRGQLKDSCALICDDHMLYSAAVPSLARDMFHIVVSKVWMPLMRRARARFVAVSDETKKYVCEFYGLKSHEVVVIPLGVDVDLFRRDEHARKAIRDRHGISEGDVVVIQTGKIVPPKGQGLLLEAAIPLLKSGAPLKLMFVGTGDPSYIKALQDKAKEDNVDSKVLWIPHVNHDSLPGYYSASDIGVWPLQESMSVQDASACGLPVVMQNSFVGRERTANGRGRTFSSVSELTEILTWLARDSSARSEMGGRGRSFVESNLGWSHLAEQFLGLASSPAGKLGDVKGIPRATVPGEKSRIA